MARVVLALLSCVLVAAGAAAWLQASRMLAPAASEPAPELFTVASGATLGRVAWQLEQAGLVRSARATRWLARWDGVEAKLKIGEYEVSPHQSPREILALLTSGKVKTWPVTLPEGTRASEIAERLEQAGLAQADAFMAAVEDDALREALGIEGESLEGYLYPDTYQLPRGMSPEQIARTMVGLFDRVWQSEIAPLAEHSALSKPQIVTLASIVEKETGAEEERPLIAAVFLNRLKKGMRLETDPTVIYGIPDFDGNIKRSHLRDDSNPYNTYKIHGLPPGPIASPGLEALRAVVQPADSDYLYFVSRNDGTHAFSSNLRDHVEAVNHYQKNRRNRQRAIDDRRAKLEAARSADAPAAAPGT